MASNGSYWRPSLKNSVDAQLQTAFSDGNWPLVIRLADKRAKALNDPYYEAVKACAESQLESPLEQCAALISVDAHVRKGTMPKDVEIFELYEWACHDFRGIFSYSDTLGVLRSRWAKANPRSPAAPQCLRSCIQNWDLVNAQQIAATLDKSLPAPSNRPYMYWSIVLTYLLSTHPLCPSDKQKIYSMLVSKQLERAADLAESTGNKDTKAPDRGLQTEEEIIFYYIVLAEQASPDDYRRRVQSPVIGALKQFDEGRKHLFLEAVKILKAREQWDIVYSMCLHTLSRKEEDGSPSFLAANWMTWKTFIEAAAKRPDVKESFCQVQSLLSAFVTVVNSRDVAPMHVKNIGLALIELTFSLPEILLPPPIMSPGGHEAPTPRLVQLCLFLEQHGDKVSAFDDLKGYVEQLSFEEARQLVRLLLPRLAGEHSESSKGAQLQVLTLKFRYLLATLPQTLVHSEAAVGTPLEWATVQCKICTTESRCSPCCGPGYGQTTPLRSIPRCRKCLEDVAAAAMDMRTEHKDGELGIDLAVVASMSLLRLAGVGAGPSRRPLLAHISVARFLQAVVLLDSQLQKTPNATPLRLLLTLLYLVLGCASSALQAWAPLDVKRTIHDALSPLFFDRISGVSPGLFTGLRPLMKPLRSYYSQSLKDPCPVKIWDAFASGSYSAVLEIADYTDRLRRSCALVMTVVEERRAARALGGRMEDLEDVDILAGITNDTELVTAIDYGSLPQLESSGERPLAESLSLGPAPSNTRSRLALLAEELIQICAFTPSKDYKPAKQNEAAAQDLAFTTENLASLHDAFTNLMHMPETPLHLTCAEESFYNVLTLLSALLLTGLTTPRTGALPPVFAMLSSSIKTAMSSLQSCSDSSATLGSLCQLSDHHSMSMLRDAAVTVKQGASFALAHHEAAAARDRTGNVGLHKDVVLGMKVLAGLGATVLASIKDRVKTLKADLSEPGWLDQVVEWTFGQDGEGSNDELAKRVFSTVGGRPVVEEWAAKVLDSWREGVKGWGMVRME